MANDTELIETMIDALRASETQLEQCAEFMDDDEELADALAEVRAAIGSWQEWKAAQKPRRREEQLPLIGL